MLALYNTVKQVCSYISVSYVWLKLFSVFMHIFCQEPRTGLSWTIESNDAFCWWY